MPTLLSSHEAEMNNWRLSTAAWRIYTTTSHYSFPRHPELGASRRVRGVARTDNDSWEITESVGATALGVAAARAADTESDDPLISDPFARVFLDTVGDGVWNWFAAPELPAEVVDAEPALPLRMKSMVDYFASRTKYFDTFFL